LIKKKKEWLRPEQKAVLAKPFFLFLQRNCFCKVKLILPALADPAAAGDPAYPVLFLL